MAVLYRKYRSQTFSEVIGQKYIIQTLKNQVAKGSVAHAYLFCGSRGIGKTSIARILAKAVNCLKQKDGEPCGKCDICRQVEAGTFLDLVEIDAASNTGVDNIRELIEHVKFSPSIGKYKVFIIDEVHMLSKGAFNALLKTLEEPPRHAIFILATTEINKVPATIISRTQRFDFKRLSAEELKEHLHTILKSEKFKLDEAVVELVANSSDGSVRDSLSLLDKIMTLGEKAGLEDCQQLLGVTDLALSENLLEKIVGGKTSELPLQFDAMLERGVDLSVFNRDFLEYLRKVLVFSSTGGKETFGLQEARAQKLSELAQKAGGLNSVIFIIRLFLKSYKDISESPDPLIPLLVAALEAASRYGPASSPANLAAAGTAEPAYKPARPIVEIKTPMAEKSETVIESSRVEVYEDAKAEEIQEIWPKVIAKIKTVNSPLANLIRMCQFQGVENGVVMLGTKFLFHKQSLEQAKNRQLVSDTIKEINGKNLGLRVVVIREEVREAADPVAAIGDALKIFGGELIE